MPQQNLGKIVPTHKGKWNSNTTYSKLDIVSHNGNSYFCIKGTVNHAVTNNTYWQVIATKGDQGDQGDTGPQGRQGPVGTAGDVAWGDVTGKPTEFAPANHSADKVTSGVFSDSRIPASITRDTQLANYALKSHTHSGISIKWSGYKYTEYFDGTKAWNLPSNSIVVDRQVKYLNERWKYRVVYRTAL